MIPSRYNITNISRVLNQPRLVLGEVRKLAQLANIRYYDYQQTKGIQVMEEDWDTLIILDGCRADMFERRCPFDGTFQTRRSRGSATPEWVRENFVDGEFHDTVYLTANAYIPDLVPEGTFHDIIWLIDDGWDDELGTARPEVVAERLVEVREQYPDKRVIAHFVQPHFPFIGDIGQRFDTSKITKGKDENVVGTPWSELQYGQNNRDRNEVWEAYCENLDLAFDALAEVLEKLDGRTVISSDHGNLAGDRMTPLPVRGFGHPVGLHVPELVTVPWFVIERGERPQIVSEPPRRTTYEASTAEQLEALGYH